MIVQPCHLGRSEIEGLGIFASAPIARGALVWRFDPIFDILVPRATLAGAPAVVRDFFERFGYEIDGHPDHLALDGDDGRFMNHADDPNLDFSVPGIAVASRDIAAGAELTCDYGHLTADPDYAMQPARPIF